MQQLVLVPMQTATPWWEALLGIAPAVLLATLAIPELLTPRTPAAAATDHRAAWILKLCGAFAVQFAVSGRLLASSTALLVFFILFPTRTIIKLISDDYSYGSRPFLPLAILRMLLSLSIFGLELLGPEGWSSGPEGYDALPTEDGPSKHSKKISPWVRANFLSRNFLVCFDAILNLGEKKKLGLDDLWVLPPNLEPEVQGERLARAWDAEIARKPSSPSLLRALLRAYGIDFVFIGIPFIAGTLISLIQPQLMRGLLVFVSDYRNGEAYASTGYLVSPLPLTYRHIDCDLMLYAKYALGMTLSSTLFTMAFTKFIIELLCLMNTLRSGLMSLIYRKVLVLARDRGSEAGTILSKVLFPFSHGSSVRKTDSLMRQVSNDFLKTLALVNLHYVLVGIMQLCLAFVSLYGILGVHALPGIAVLAVTSPLPGFIAKMAAVETKKRAEAVDKRTRLMADILGAVKTIKLYAWESALGRRLYEIRNDVELHHLRRRYFLLSISDAFAGVAPTFVALASYSSFAKYSGRPLTPEIVFPALALFGILAEPLQTLVPLIRIIIDAPVGLRRLETLLNARELSADAVERNPATSPSGDAIVIKDASFAWSEGASPILKSINLTIKAGQFCALVGVVGSGKSSLLSGILGNMTKLSGTVSVSGTSVYTDQVAWIVRGTVEENIRKHILKRVLGPEGLLRNATRILCTNSALACSMADEIIYVHEGSIVERKSDTAVISDLAQAVPQLNATLDDEKLSEPDTTIQPAVATSTARKPSETEISTKSGAVQWDLVKVYARWATPLGFYGMTVMAALNMVLSICVTVWLKRWTESGGSGSLALWLGVYIALGLLLGAAKLLAGVFSGCISACRSAATAYTELFDGVLRSPMRFFDKTPAGTIQNRFLGDIASLEITLPYVVSITMETFFSIIGKKFIIILLGRKYLKTSREVIRLDAALRAPILTSIQETSQGADTIRAFRQQERFRETFFEAVRSRNCSDFCNILTSRWIAVRLQFIGIFFLLATTSFAIFSVTQLKSSMDSALIGLMLTYVLALRQNLATFGEQFLSEAAKYLAKRTYISPVLFRIIEAESGSVVIDGVDVGQIGLHDLRSRIGIIPQDGQFFQASIRVNLDPLGTTSDEAIWDALLQAGMKDHVEHMDGQLEATVEENGRNLSAGQRQLLCLCRVLLRRPRILAIDEATSSIDLESDKRVQAAIRTTFKGCTTITIAHRIDTIMDCDKVLVMAEGRVAEFGTPKELIRSNDSLFSALVTESGAGLPEA
ncbi:hypothetical protein RQP46_003426 [Phenoliferia psychrophenolica]